LSLDWGYNKPFSLGWYAVIGDSRLIRYRDWYGCEEDKHNVGIRMKASEVAKTAWESTVETGVQWMVADPGIWKKESHEEDKCIADYFADAGFSMEKANNNRISGWATLHDYLKTTGHDGYPMLQVFNTCRGWIRTFPEQLIDANKPEDIDTDGEDHVADETRYAVMSRFAKPVRIKPSKYDHTARIKDEKQSEWRPLRG
jgi:hypothetical protein